MNEFFDKRIESYDEHMKGCIDDYKAYYDAIIDPIENQEDLRVLILGCGTGAEASVLFERYPHAHVVCYDLSDEMLQAFAKKFEGHAIELRKDSYFNLYEKNKYDYVIAVMTMHHWTYKEKHELYSKIHEALKPDGLYIEGDYYVTLEEEQACIEKRADLLKDAEEDVYYHIDIPFHYSTQEKLLNNVGFTGFTRSYMREEKEVHVVSCNKSTN